MDFIYQHFGEILTAISLLSAAIAFGVGTYIAVRTDLTRQYERHTALKEKVDEHIKNPEVHFHRRETDLTGRWPRFEG
jgi:hypothetical protein